MHAEDRGHPHSESSFLKPGSASGGLTISLFQFNPVLGDLQGNADRIIEAMRLYAGRSDLLVTPESSVTGYPVEDMIESGDFMREVAVQVARIKAAAADGSHCPVIIGAPAEAEDGSGRVTNSAFLFSPDHAVRIDKHQLPNYGPFDEKRWFLPGRPADPVTFKGVRLGILICEDAWFSEGAAHIADKGCDLLIIVNGSPYVTEKHAVRQEVVRRCWEHVRSPVIYLNQVGGQDELVFDGSSFAMNASGELALRMPRFQGAVSDIQLSAASGHFDISAFSGNAVTDAKSEAEWNDSLRSDYMALVLALRDYVGKNGFRGVMLGVSGGIDSAVSAMIAVDALGADRVWGIMMPFRWTSDESIREAREVADNLGIKYDTIPIVDPVDSLKTAIGGASGIELSGVALENLQARIRGTILMSLSNQSDQERHGYMVLSTGNKSEVSVGYATLYGDMCGGFNILKDVYKTRVYELASWRNAVRPVGCLGPSGICVPTKTITREPSAELAPGQKDQDSLPPYPVLDAILRLMVDEWKDIDEIAAEGHSRSDILRVRRLLDRAEYKRRQGAPGAKITKMIFSRDRRVPITNRFSPR